jgi:hypothetical protein
MQRLPWTFHIYILFPIFFWQDVTRRVYANWPALRGHGFGDVGRTLGVLLRLFLAVVALQSMVVRHLLPSFSLLCVMLSETLSEVWVHQSNSLELRFRRHWARLAYDLLARKRQREALLALGCRVHCLSDVPTASRGSLRAFDHYVNNRSTEVGIVFADDLL